MELLFELIENEKLAISEISLAKVADDYIRYVRALEKIDPEALAEFLVVAVHLMLIKSKSLLPSLELPIEDQIAIDDLEKRLEEYKKIRVRAIELKEIESQHRHIFSREQYLGLNAIFYPPPKLSAEKIKETFSAFLKALPKLEKLAEEKIKRIVSLEERISEVRSFLEKAITRSFSELVKGAGDKIDIIVSFLAILELARERFLDLEQTKSFGDIVIKRT